MNTDSARVELTKLELSAWAKTIDSIALDVVATNFAAGTALMTCAVVIREAAARARSTAE